MAPSRPRRETLDAAQPTRLVALEAVIERGMQTFVEVGGALLEILNTGLYKEAGYASKKAYIEGRWGFTPQRAHQVMQAAEVVNLLPASTAVDVSERQARELAPLRDQPDAVREVWGGLVERAGVLPRLGESEGAFTKRRKAVSVANTRSRDDQNGYAIQPRRRAS